MEERIFIPVREVEPHITIFLQSWGVIVRSNGIYFPSGSARVLHVHGDITVHTEWYAVRLPGGPAILEKRDKKQEESQIFVSEEVKNEALATQDRLEKMHELLEQHHTIIATGNNQNKYLLKASGVNSTKKVECTVYTREGEQQYYWSANTLEEAIYHGVRRYFIRLLALMARPWSKFPRE